MRLSQPHPRQALVPVALLALMSSPARGQATPKPAESPVAQAKMDDAKVAGQEVGVPTRRKYVAPAYPAAAAEQGIRGIVILEVLIGETGTVIEARVTRSIPGLDDAAVAAVRLWEYEPTKMNGKPVKVRLSQSITFSLKLPDLQRAPGVPELKSGGSPPPPANLTSPQSASVAVVLGPDGEVKEASVVSGLTAICDPLLRAVKSWRFATAENSTALSLTIQADWTPGPPPAVTLKALGPKPVGALAEAGSGAPPLQKEIPAGVARAAEAPTPSASPATPVAPILAPIPTDVLPAQAPPPTPERGISAIADVTLGESIPDLVKGRRPVWPPLARLGNVGGEVVVRFSVDVAGKVTVHSAEGPDLLKASAEGAVGTWLFRRTSIDRLHLIATFKFGTDRSVARIERAQP